MPNETVTPAAIQAEKGLTPELAEIARKQAVRDLLAASGTLAQLAAGAGVISTERSLEDPNTIQIKMHGTELTVNTNLEEGTTTIEGTPNTITEILTQGDATAPSPEAQEELYGKELDPRLRAVMGELYKKIGGKAY